MFGHIDTSEQYQTYLLSEHWRLFKIKVRRARNNSCENCGMDDEQAYKKYRQRLNVHHKTYKGVGHEKLEDVELLCYRCHMNQHGNVNWVDFVQSFSMPKVKSFHPFCANCGVEMYVELWNQDELDQELCQECLGK